MNTPWSSVGYLTFKRTYARRINEEDQNSPTEEYSDTINRVVKAAQTQLNCGFTKPEEARLRKYMTQLKGTVAGRFLWQMGTPTVERLGLASLQNCAAVVVDSPVDPFTWTMDMLMLGSGVGYNIQKEHVDKLPPVNADFKTPTRRDQGDSEFIVPDSREGWVALLGKTLKAAFLAHRSGKQTFTFSTQLIRSKGAPIKGFGGTASGPDDLVWGITKIGSILEKRVGKKLRPIDCLDIMNIIGAVVVAGNVRRCLPGETLVQVNETEWKKIMDMSEEDLIYIDGEFHKVNAMFEQGEQEVYKIELGDGTFIEATPNHRWYVFDESDNSMKWVETQHLSGQHSMIDPT